MHEGDTEFWRRRFLGEGFNGNHVKPVDMEASELPDELDEDEDDDDVDDDDDIEDVAKEVEDEEADEEGGVEVEEQSESQDAERIVKAKEAEAKKPLQMIGVQLLKDSDQTSRMSKKSRRRAARLAVAVQESIRFAAFLFPFLFFIHFMLFIKLICLIAFVVSLFIKSNTGIPFCIILRFLVNRNL